VQTINFFISQQEPSQQAGGRARLEAMLGFVETNVCRRRPLLSYFGESYEKEACEQCDNCTTEAGDLVDLTIPAQKFLSCVKRTGEFFGLNHIIDVLRGSQSQKVLSRGHDKLSTYNIGGEFSKKEWQYLARQFIQEGLMVQDMEHGSLKLTPKAYAVFKGEPVRGTLPDKPQAAPSAIDYANYDQNLFQLLRQTRKTLADEAGVPPYVIFSDRTLVEMATYFPQSRSSFGTLYGVGEAKLANFADTFLPIVQNYCAENNVEEVRKSAPTAVSSSSSTPGGRTLEVLNLYNNGRSLPELCQQYNVKRSTIINHLWKAVVAGETLRESNLLEQSTLSPEQQQQALAAFAEHGTEYLRPVYLALNETVDYEELHLLRLHFVSVQS
jgi:ATP-dependent DNA helicase RecQ